VRIPIAIMMLALSALRAAGAPAGGATPFELLDDGSVVIAVTIGGTGPYRFVLDTGSSRTVISRGLWTTLRAPAVAQTIMVTPAGRTSAYIVRLDAVSIGDRPAMRADAAVVPDVRYASGGQIDGLIGQDVLSTLVYTIDYQLRVVVWHPPGELMPGVRLPLSVQDNRVLVRLAQYDGDQQPLALIPDSGSDGLVLFAHVKDRLRLTPLEVGVLTSMSGARLAHRVQLSEIVIGETRLKHPFAVLVDNQEPAETMGDGLLPLHVFSRVTFNVAERYLIVAAR
jgi:predicted aspartyl protease